MNNFILGKTVFRIMMKHNLRLYKKRKVENVRKDSAALIMQAYTTPLFRGDKRAFQRISWYRMVQILCTHTVQASRDQEAVYLRGI
jgi:hypothetical protein